MNSEVKSAARVLDLIEFLAGCADPVPLKQIAAQLGFPKSSAHALAQTLVSRGYAIQDAAERYVLVGLGRHGSALRSQEALLLSAAHPVMAALRDGSGETVMLSVRTSRGGIRRLAKCVSRQVVRYDVEIDAPSELFCTATGRVFLAWLDDTARDAYFARTRLVAYTGATVTETTRIMRLLANVRRRGYAVNDEEYVAGSTGISAPIRDRQGAVIAALTLGMPSARYRLQKAAIASAVKDSAATIGARLAPGSARRDGVGGSSRPKRAGAELITHAGNPLHLAETRR